MADEIENTELDKWIPEVWRPQALEGRYAAMKFAPRSLSTDAEVRGRGDIVHISIEPIVSVNDVGAAGALTNQALTPTEVQLTVDKWKESTIDVVDKAEMQSLISARATFPRSFGRAMGQQIDDDVFALQTAANLSSNQVGSSSTSPDEALLTSAVQKLMEGDVPTDNPNDITFSFHPKDWAALKQIDAFNDANITGMSQGGALTQNLPSFYGIPVVVSSRVAASGGARLNGLTHRQTYAWAMQQNFKIEQLARTKLSTPIVGSALYGVKLVREDHGVLIQTDD